MLCFGKFLVAKKLLNEKRGEYRKFPSRIFCPKMLKSFVEEPYSVSLTSGIEKSHASEAYVTIFRRNLLTHSTGKIIRGTLLCCVSENFLVAKKFMDKKEGEVSRSPSNVFLSHSDGSRTKTL